jgi:hypothetical protein
VVLSHYDSHGVIETGGDMMDKTTLNGIKGLLKAKDKKYADCAKALGIAESSFSNKINGTSKFYIDELNELGNYLGLSSQEKSEFFLP